jgi:hypothetical protein
MHNELRY